MIDRHLLLLAVGLVSSRRVFQRLPDTTHVVPPIDSALAKLAPRLTISTSTPTDFIVQFSGRAGGTPESESIRAARSIRYVHVDIYSPSGQLLDTLATSAIESSGTVNGETNEASLNLSASLPWHSRTAIVPRSYVIMSIVGANGSIALRQTLPYATSNDRDEQFAGSIAMQLDVTDKGDHLDISLATRRVAPPPPGEYLPTTERYVVEIINANNELVWSTSQGNVFVVSREEVEPQEVGEDRLYTMSWDGSDRVNGVMAKPGTYVVRATIPATPVPYTVKKEIHWRGR